MTSSVDVTSHLKTMAPAADSDFHAAAIKFLDGISDEHSVAAGKYSVWPMIQKLLDSHVRRLVDEYLDSDPTFDVMPERMQLSLDSLGLLDEARVDLDTWMKKKLRTFRLSDARFAFHNKDTGRCSSAIHGHNLTATHDVLQNLRSSSEFMRAMIHAVRSSSDRDVGINAQLSFHCLKRIHTLNDFCDVGGSPASISPSAGQRLISILDYCRELFNWLARLVPRRYRDCDGFIVSWREHTYNREAYCELCFRRTKRSIAGLVALPSFTGLTTSQRARRIRTLSDRFCFYHDSQQSKLTNTRHSVIPDKYLRYERDRAYREIFERECLARLFPGLLDFSCTSTLVVADSLETQEIRKAVYEAIHLSGVYRLSEGKLILTARGRVFDVLNKQFNIVADSRAIQQIAHTGIINSHRALIQQLLGCVTQVEIATELNISRQAAHKHCKALQEYFDYRATHTAVLLKEEAFPLEDDVAMLVRNSGNVISAML